MFAPSAFSGLHIEHKLCSEVARMPMNSFHVRAKYFGNHQNMKEASWKLSTKQKGRIKRNVRALVSPPDNSIGGSGSFSLSETTKQFYACINLKDVNQLSKFISQDCEFEDFSSQPIEGKQEVMGFLKQLVDNMGVNVTFNIRDLCEADDFSITLNWHLEWNKKQTPFAGGCSYYEWAIEGPKLVIRKFRIVSDTPMKPEDSVLILQLKVLSWLFDTFPQATEFFSSHNEE